MKNKDILLLAEGLPTVDVPDMKYDFNYLISENILDVERIAISIRKGLAPSDRIKEFEIKSKELMEEHAEKDTLGNPIYEERVTGKTVLYKYDIPGLADPESAYNKAFKELEAEYQKDIDAHEAKKDSLEEENPDFKPHMIDKKDVPDGLSRYMSDVVHLLIDKDTV